MFDTHRLRDAIEYFDTTIEQLVLQNYESINIKDFGKSYNQIKTALAHYMMLIEERDEQS